MFGDLNAQGERAEMRDLAEEIDGSLGVTALKLPIRGAHTAKSAYAAVGTNRLPRGFGRANLPQAAVPTLLKAAGAHVVAFAMGKDADGHFPIGIDGASVVPAAAGVALCGNGEIRREFGFDEPQILAAAKGIAKFQCDGLLGSQSHGERTLRTIGAGIHQWIELEFHAQILLGESFHFIDFVNIHGSGNGFKFEGQAALKQQGDTPHAAVERARNLGQSIVGFPRRAIQGDLNIEGAVFHEVVRNPRRNQGAVGEQGDQESTPFRLGVNIQKVLAGENFAAGVEQPKAAKIDEFIKQPDMFFERQLLLASVGIAHRKIVVAVLALQRTAMGHLNRDFDGHASAREALVKEAGEITVCRRLNHPETFLPAKIKRRRVQASLQAENRGTSRCPSLPQVLSLQIRRKPAVPFRQRCDLQS